MRWRRGPLMGASRRGRRERLTFAHPAAVAVPMRPALADLAHRAHEPGPVRLRRLETWDWGWGGLLLFSILLFFRPQDTFAPLGAAHVSDLCAIVGLAAMVFVNVSRGESPIRITPEVAGVFALALVVLATVPFSIWPGGALRVFTDQFIQVTLIFLLMANTMTSPKRINRICWVIVLAFGYVSARVCLDYLRGVNLVEGNRAAGPVGGFFQNPNDLALNLAAFLPLAMVYVLRSGSVARRLLCAGISILMLAALIFTKSRGGALALVTMLAVFVVASRLVTPATILAGVLALAVITPAIPQSFWDRMASITDASRDPTGSRAERKALIEDAWRTFLRYPLTGVGAGQFENYSETGEIRRWRVTHNTPLQLAADIGIGGVVAFYLLVVRGVAAAWWTRRRAHRGVRDARGRAITPDDGLDARERRFFETHGAALLAGMAGWFVAAMFASVAYSWTFYYLLGLSVAGRDVMRGRARAWRDAQQTGTSGVVAA